MKVNLGTIELSDDDLRYIGEGKKAKRSQAREWCLEYLLTKLNRQRRGGLFDGPSIFEDVEPPAKKRGTPLKYDAYGAMRRRRRVRK